MAYRVSGSLIVHRKGADVVLDEERITCFPELGLASMMTRLLERLETHRTDPARLPDEITVLLWAEPYQSTDESMRLAAQREVDRVRAERSEM